MSYLLEGEADLHRIACSLWCFPPKICLSVFFLVNANTTSGLSWVTTKAMIALGVFDMSLILSFISATACRAKYFLDHQNDYAENHNYLLSHRVWSLTLLDVCYSGKFCNLNIFDD